MGIQLSPGAEPVPGYILMGRLGQGGFGEVWEARAPGGVRVALKFIRLGTRQAEPELRALEVIRDIRHPHLLDVQFAVQVEDCLAIAMPLCDESLLDRLEACRARGLRGVPRNELLGYMDEVARAVDFLNEPRHPSGDGTPVGVQHRDIKPQNIFLVGGSARLADFGLSKVLGARQASHTGSMTPHYAAPEVHHGRVSRWTDQYALAVTYYQLRTGLLPFSGDSLIQIIYAHDQCPPDLSGLAGDEAAAIARALSKRPEGRWPTCRAFVVALRKAALAEGGRTSLAKAGAVGDRAKSAEAGAVSAALGISIEMPPHPESAGPATSSSRIGRPSRATVGMAASVLVGLAALVAVVVGFTSRRPPGEAATPAPAPATGEPAPSIINSLGMKLVLIPAGEFAMGSGDDDPDAEDDEKPRHRVRIARPFYLGAKEVTLGQFRRVAESSGLRADAEKDGKGGGGFDEATGRYARGPQYTWRNPGFAQTDRHPVVNVSWNDAIAFCNALSALERRTPYYTPGGEPAPSGGDGYRLPTEAEWEYACRAGTSTRYWSGDDRETLADVGNVADGTAKEKFSDWAGVIEGRDGYVTTAPAGRYPANPWGLHDMHGNVWEWCWDRYASDEYGRPPVSGPPGAPQGSDRVNRGGGWYSSPRADRSANRYWRAPDSRGTSLGFRVARSVTGR